MELHEEIKCLRQDIECLRGDIKKGVERGFDLRRDMEDLREKIEKLISLYRHPDRQRKIYFGVGDTLEEVVKMSIKDFTITPGQTRWLSAIFSDNATPPVVHALKNLPTCTDTSDPAAANPLALALVGAGGAVPTVNDPEFFASVAAPSGAVVGATGKVTWSGINPDGTVDTQDISYTVVAGVADDTIVTVDVQDQAP